MHDTQIKARPGTSFPARTTRSNRTRRPPVKVVLEAELRDIGLHLSRLENELQSAGPEDCREDREPKTA